MSKDWISGAIKHPGALHRALRVPEDEKIPKEKIEKATHSEKTGLAKKAALAQTLAGFHRANGGECSGMTPRAKETMSKLTRRHGAC